MGSYTHITHTDLLWPESCGEVQGTVSLPSRSLKFKPQAKELRVCSEGAGANIHKKCMRTGDKHEIQ